MSWWCLSGELKTAFNPRRVDVDDDDDNDALVDDAVVDTIFASDTVAAADADVVDDDDDVDDGDADGDVDEGSLADWPVHEGKCTYRDRWTDKYSFIGRVKGRMSFLYKRN